MQLTDFQYWFTSHRKRTHETLLMLDHRVLLNKDDY